MKIHFSLACIFISISSAFFLVDCGQDKSGKNKDTKPKDYPVLTLRATNRYHLNDYPATIQGEEIVEIRPMVDGYLEAIYVKEGATVTKGQQLFRIKKSSIRTTGSYSRRFY